MIDGSAAELTNSVSTTLQVAGSRFQVQGVQGFKSSKVRGSWSQGFDVAHREPEPEPEPNLEPGTWNLEPGNSFDRARVRVAGSSS
jgi:hypothetical protein